MQNIIIPNNDYQKVFAVGKAFLWKLLFQCFKTRPLIYVDQLFKVANSCYFLQFFFWQCSNSDFKAWAETKERKGDHLIRCNRFVIILFPILNTLVLVCTTLIRTVIQIPSPHKSFKLKHKQIPILRTTCINESNLTNNQVLFIYLVIC